MRGAISGLAVGMAEFALDSVIIGASANLLTAPLAFLFFGFSSLYSIPATVLFSPLAGLLLSLSPFALLPSSFVLTPYAASVVASIPNFVSRLASACAVLAYEMGPFGALAVTGMLLYGLPFILRGPCLCRLWQRQPAAQSIARNTLARHAPACRRHRGGHAACFRRGGHGTEHALTAGSVLTDALRLVRFTLIPILLDG